MLHHREELYTNPHAFMPERFLGNRPATSTWIPFGAGQRRCVGAALALLEIEVILEAIGRSVELRPTSARREGAIAFAVGMVPDRGAEVVRVAPGTAGGRPPRVAPDGVLA
jgi:cytochrome P450